MKAWTLDDNNTFHFSLKWLGFGTIVEIEAKKTELLYKHIGLTIASKPVYSNFYLEKEATNPSKKHRLWKVHFDLRISTRSIKTLYVPFLSETIRKWTTTGKSNQLCLKSAAWFSDWYHGKFWRI